MQTCKHCGTPLLTRSTRRTPEQLLKPYYYTAYYFCPNCHRMYHSDEFKVMNENYSLFTTQTVEGNPDVEIWTDGACRGNGTPEAKAAWAFVSGDYEASGPVEGKQTNNRGEAFAILHALEWAAERGFKRIKLYTDSQISLQSLAKPVDKVKANQEIFASINAIIKEHVLVVQYVKVPGHADNEGNNRADKLANTLAGIAS